MGHTTNKQLQVFYIILGYTVDVHASLTHILAQLESVSMVYIGRATWNTGKAILSGGATAGGLCSTIVAP